MRQRRSRPTPHRRRLSALAQSAWLLLALVVPTCLGQGVRVTEVTDVIARKHYTGPLVFSPDGTTLALPVPEGGRLELWTLGTRTGQVVKSRSNQGEMPALHVAFSKDGRSLAIEYQDTGISLRDLPAKRERAFVPIAPPRWVADMAFAGDRSLVAIVASVTQQDIEAQPTRWNHSVVRWDPVTGNEQGRHAFDPILEFKALSPDGRFASLGDDAKQIVFDLATCKAVFSSAVDARDVLVFSEDGTALVSYDGEFVSVRDVPSGKEANRFKLKHRDTSYSYCLSLSPDKKELAIGRFREIYSVGLVSLESGLVFDIFEIAHASMICHSVRFAPGGRLLATDTYAEDVRDRAVDPLLRFWKVPALRTPSPSPGKAKNEENRPCT